jgi:hypothetical protein
MLITKAHEKIKTRKTEVHTQDTSLLKVEGL